MSTRNTYYDIEQITYSFNRYRQDHIFDKDSYKQQFIKHFNENLYKKMGEKVWEQQTIQQAVERNRTALEERGKLPEWKYSNKELKEATHIREWKMAELKGRKVRVHQIKIKIKGKERMRWRDSYGRFTSNPTS
jgi:hypothetical protein